MMARQLFGVAGAALLSAVLAACSSTPTGLPTRGEDEAATSGTVSVPLTTDNNGTTYRLAKAQFTITGAALSAPLVIKPAADLPIDTETLPVGSYSIVLRGGWVLESKGPADTTFQTVSASLITPNPTTFTVTKGGTTNVYFGFATGVGEVALGQGDANIRISVQDCSEFNGYAAALASFTVDCLGTIDQSSFTVSADGSLSRNFNACPNDPTKLDSIDAFLSLQLRTVRLPFAKECIAGRWSDWKATFDKSGVTQCPMWRKDQVIGAPTAALIDRLIPQLAQLPQDDNGARPAFLQQLKESYVYTVSFPTQPPGQGCKTPDDCAQLCAGGFPGFVIRTDPATSTVLTDPPYWLLDTTYPNGNDPFLRAGYYHPMSYYGPLPGTQFAHRNREAPCPGCKAEDCSYFAGIHIHIPLKCDCLNPANNATCPASDTTCVGFCAP